MWTQVFTIISQPLTPIALKYKCTSFFSISFQMYHFLGKLQYKLTFRNHFEVSLKKKKNCTGKYFAPYLVLLTRINFWSTITVRANFFTGVALFVHIANLICHTLWLNFQIC